MSGPIAGGVQFVKDVVRQTSSTSDDAEPDIVLQERLLFQRQNLDQQPHQRVDLAGWAFPVLLAE